MRQQLVEHVTGLLRLGRHHLVLCLGMLLAGLTLAAGTTCGWQNPGLSPTATARQNAPVAQSTPLVQGKLTSTNQHVQSPTATARQNGPVTQSTPLVQSNLTSPNQHVQEVSPILPDGSPEQIVLTPQRMPTSVSESQLPYVGIWTSHDELVSLPTSGVTWDNLYEAAQQDTSNPDISDQDDKTDVYVLAKALVYARTGETRYRDEVIYSIMLAMGTEQGGRTLALGRNLVAYVIAADLVNLSANANEDKLFKLWLSDVRTEDLDGRTLISTHEDRPNNWGTHAGASRIAAALYLGDTADLEEAVKVFKGFLGDRSSYSNFRFQTGSQNAQSWSPYDVDNLVPINPQGAMVDGYNTDGAIIDDISRGAPLQWPPAHTQYPWEGLAGLIVQAELLHRAGYPAYEWEDQAIRRAYEYLLYLHEQHGYWFEEGTTEGDDNWQPWIVNHRYGINLPTVTPTKPGKNVGWTDWTHSATDQTSTE